MPYSIRKTDHKFSVRSPSNVHARGTSKEKAKAQVRLLRGVEHGWRPTGRKLRGRQ